MFLPMDILIWIIMVVTVYYFVSKTVKQNVFDQLEFAADVLSGHIHLFLEKKKERIIDFSSDGFIRDCTEEITMKENRREYYTTALKNHLITNKKSLQPGILEVFVVDLKGKVIASTDKSRVGEDVSNKGYFSKAEYLSAFVSDPHYDAHLKEILIDFSTLLLNKVEREHIGVIVNRIRFEQQEDRGRGGASTQQDTEGYYSHLIAVNKSRVIDFSSDGFIRDCAEEIVKRENRVRHYTNSLNKHLIMNKKPLNPDILEVFVVDLDGKVISSTENGLIDKDVSGEVYFSETMNRDSYISNLHYSPEFKQNSYETARLLLSKEGQEPIGIIVNRYNSDSLRKVTRSGIREELEQEKLLTGFGETGELYIVNRDKLMITESRFIKDAILKQVVDTVGVRAAFENGVGMIGIYSDYRGIQILGASRYIEEMDWAVLAEKDVSEAFAPIIRLRNITIIIAIAGTVVVVIIVIFIATGITRPIRKLLEGTKKIAKGDFVFRMEAKSKDEIGQLAASFNNMTSQLSESKKQLQDYALNLEKKVEDKTKEIKHMLDELTYKNKEMEQIIYVTSHDLRAPLLNIQGFSKELEKDLEQVRQNLNERAFSSDVKKKLAEILEVDIPDALRFIVTSSSKMDTLLSGLLRVSCVGRVVLTIEQLDMNKLISNVIETYGYKIKETNVILQVDELPSCRGDKAQINQVFSNLIDNAFKYLDHHGEGIIKISGRKENEHNVYCLEDNGIGIAERHQDKIFQIFHRLNPGDGVVGEGLGLTIVRKILDLHGGKIWVESEPGKGSKFFVSLPA
ncbi:MAG: two-component sensor kinase [Candidatus Scalindua rubra]|uniref:histidine kinase n=1 Tax=Candidatus Scalindua rubra TaxID=1872076 RepID=A0A1E3X5Y6_9BACT|nr:MAG: two-component sensor kinase [Candidatus Scalindua rubra]